MSFKIAPVRNRNSLFLPYLLSCLFLPVLTRAAEEDIWQFIPETAATVDQRVITRKRLVGELLKNENLAHYRALPPSQLRSAALAQVNQMIGRILLEEMVAAAGIRISPDEIKNRFNELFAGMTPMQRELLYSHLRKDKIDLSDYLENIVRDDNTIFSLGLRKLIGQKFPGRLEVSDTQCESYYRENQTLFEMPSRVSLSRIYISFAGEARLLKEQHPELAPAELVANSEKNAFEKISRISRMTMSNADFAGLARQYSHCPSAIQGGLLGSFAKGGGLDPGTEKIVFGLTPGVISDVIPLEGGYQLLRVNRIIPPGYAPLDEVLNFIREDMQNRLIDKLSEKMVRDARRQHRIMVYF